MAIPVFITAGFVGLAAPANTPAPVIAYLNKQLNDAIHTEEFKKRIELLGMTVPDVNTPESFTEFMQRELVRQAALAKLTGHGSSAK